LSQPIKAKQPQAPKKNPLRSFSPRVKSGLQFLKTIKRSSIASKSAEDSVSEQAQNTKGEVKRPVTPVVSEVKAQAELVNNPVSRVTETKSGIQNLVSYFDVHAA
jgi:hypothetical protein